MIVDMDNYYNESMTDAEELGTSYVAMEDNIEVSDDY